MVSKTWMIARFIEATWARGSRTRDKDGKPTRGPRYEREFGVPEDKAQENFTDPGFD